MIPFTDLLFFAFITAFLLWIFLRMLIRHPLQLLVLLELLTHIRL